MKPTLPEVKPLCCPECGGRAVDVAEGYGPFVRTDSMPLTMRSVNVAASCANGHHWIESQRYGQHGKPEGERSKTPYTLSDS